MSKTKKQTIQDQALVLLKEELDKDKVKTMVRLMKTKEDFQNELNELESAMTKLETVSNATELDKFRKDNSKFMRNVHGYCE